MVHRQGKAPETEPEESSFESPSEKEHLLQIVDVFDVSFKENKFNLDDDTVIAKCEVVGGEEEGRTLLNRCTIEFDGKGFWATRLFLKAISEPCRGEFAIDTENWIGKQFYATVIHNNGKNGKKYANIKEYNFDKVVEEVDTKPDKVKPVDEEVEWDKNE